MTKKDYIAISKAISNAWIRSEQLNGKSSKIESLALVDELIKVFESDNPKFNAQRFIEACTK